MEEEGESTRGEKILAASLVLFLFIGGVRVLLDVSEIPERPDYISYMEKYHIDEMQRALSGLYAERDAALSIRVKAQEEHLRKEEEYTYRREEYRVLLEEGKESAELKELYEKAKVEYEISDSYLRIAEKRLEEVETEVKEKEGEMNENQLLMSQEYEKAMSVYNVKVLGLRVLVVLPIFVCSVFVFLKLKKTSYGILSTSLLAFSVLLFLYMLFEYVVKTQHIFAASLLGASLCGGALVWLKREYYSFENISKKRIGEGKCPWCQAPIKGEFCYSCGRLLEETCPQCGKKKPVFTKYCPYCGNGKE